MKRATQILSVLLVLILGTGPAWAALGCASDPGMGSACPMGASAMDADCPMAHSLAGPDCSRDCCELQTPTADVLNALTSKPSPVKALPAVAAVPVAFAVEGASHPVVMLDLAGSSPPRYILLRVFRI